MKLVLASSSPRRNQLLREAGFEFETARPEIPESLRPREAPRAMVRRLAESKASAIGAREGRVGAYLVIGSDTTVVAPNRKRILEKPLDVADSERMLRLLSGKTHSVLTGVSIQEWSGSKLRKKKTFVVETKVSFRKIAPAEIALYARSEEPRDKAGSYAAQGKGMSFISKVNGSYSSVIGLPVAEVVEALAKHWKIRPHA